MCKKAKIEKGKSVQDSSTQTKGNEKVPQVRKPQIHNEAEAIRPMRQQPYVVGLTSHEQ